MGQIEPVGPAGHVDGAGDGQIVRRSGALRSRHVGYEGQPVAYVDTPFVGDEAWRRLSPDFRRWAEDHAGAPIVDPHTKAPTVYRTCRVDPELRGRSRGAAVRASYNLMMFGHRALVVSSGTTENLIDPPGTTRWRHRRFDVPVDPSGVRHDHRRDAAPNLARGAAAKAKSVVAADAAGALLPADVANTFGNLPLPTQEFLLEPFVTGGRRPLEACVHAEIEWERSELRETYWVYLFNARSMSVACAWRTVTIRNVTRMARLVSRSREFGALQKRSWKVAAWTAPVL